MKIKGAMTILAKEAKFLGMSSIEETVSYIEFNCINDNSMAFPLKVIQAYEVYMRDKGYVWSGVNYQTWVKKEII